MSFYKDGVVKIKKGGKKMSKISRKVFGFGLCVLTVGLFLSNVGQLFAGIDVTAGVPSTATVSVLSVMTIQAKDRATHVNVSSISWGMVNAGSAYQLPQAYILVTSTSNRSAWSVDVYTNNTPRVSVNSVAGVYQAAGLYNNDALSGTTNFIRLPVLWIVSGSPIGVVNVGGPSVVNVVSGSTTTANMGWMYMKDKADLEDSAINGDQSWVGCKTTGYTTCLYGGPGYRNLPIGITTAASNYVYVEGDFTPAAGGKSYETKIWFDLYY
ncbi:MAG: hypothetical protein ABID79_02530 [Elusimicrobiota bacterium]